MPTQIEELSVTNFRCLKKMNLKLQSLNVLIGPNGSGKTTVLDIFNLVAAGARQNLARKISEYGGVSTLLTVDNTEANAIQFGLLVKVEWFKKPIAFAFGIEKRGLGYVVGNERLWPLEAKSQPTWPWIENIPGKPRYYDFVQKKMLAPAWEGFDELELMLGQVPKDQEKQERFRKLLADTGYFSYLDVGNSSVIRNPQNLEPNLFLPGPNGENLISALYNLRTAHGDVFQRIMEANRAAFPGFREVDFPLVAAGKATMIWMENGRKFYPHQMSEGTLRYLWLTTLLLSPALPAITLIDEPEVSLHPELLMLLAGLLQEASQRSFIIVSTHSDRLIRWLKPEEVVVVDREDGLSTLRRASDPSLKVEEWLKEYTLDEIWLMGELGGRP